MKFTKREEELLTEFIDLTKNNYYYNDIYLTGSLALKLLGYEVTHECDDIDLVITRNNEERFYCDSFKEIICESFETLNTYLPVERYGYYCVDYDSYPERCESLTSFAFKYERNYDQSLHIIFDFCGIRDVNVVEYNGYSFHCANVEDIIRAKLKHHMYGSNPKHLEQVKSLLEQGLIKGTKKRHIIK